MDKILVIGQLGYHEENIVKPILNKLKEMNYQVDRLGGNFDFFIKDNYNSYVNNCFSSIPKNIEDYSIIFFVDYWNMILPIFNYLRSIRNRNCKFVTLFHGSVKFENDVARNIMCSSEYEKYLLSSYDTIIVHDIWCKSEIGEKNNSKVKVAKFPFTLQFSRQINEWKYNPKVIYAHRFDEDKGCEEFLDFVDFCNLNSISKIKFLVTDERPLFYKNRKNLKFIGRLSQEQLKEICRDGGYAWSSVKSEMAHYTILDLLSYGLTPLLNYHKAYYYFNEKYKYKSFSDAYRIIYDQILFNKEEWNILDKKLNKINDIVNLIIGE